MENVRQIKSNAFNLSIFTISFMMMPVTAKGSHGHLASKLVSHSSFLKLVSNFEIVSLPRKVFTAGMLKREFLLELSFIRKKPVMLKASFYFHNIYK